jgi:carbonic anhydrase
VLSQRLFYCRHNLIINQLLLDMKNLKDVFKNNEKWISEKLDIDENYFEKLSEGQTPEFLYIGCSDSRVTAEDLMGIKPGEAFVHRNIANLVVNTDLNLLSVIIYAVEHLKVNHIVICGHYECGGVKAAMGSLDLGLMNPWLRNIRDVYRLHRRELNAIEVDAKKYDRLVELNVQEQCVNVLKLAVVQKAYFERKLQIHGWVFDVHTGRLIDLALDFPNIVKDIRDIYLLS